ncbi:hypothetical protein EB118_09570 [bacterium]|nr:hypothetical protein [bacterium]
MENTCYLINKHSHNIKIIELFDPKNVILISPMETILFEKHSNFTLFCEMCKVGNYPGSSCSVTPQLHSGNPVYYFIHDFTIQESHWLCPCFGCDPTYLEVVPAGNESRAISIYFDY